MPSLTNPLGWHIVSYGTLLGTTFFNTFFQGIVSFKHLPRSSFSTLQQHLFPPYFLLQTALPVGCLLSSPSSPLSLAPFTQVRANWPLLSMSVLGATNWLLLGPWTTRVMKERKHQETRDGKKYDAEGEKSERMRELNSQFSLLHSLSSVVNLADWMLMVYYGFVLADGVMMAPVGFAAA